MSRRRIYVRAAYTVGVSGAQSINVTMPQGRGGAIVDLVADIGSTGGTVLVAVLDGSVSPGQGDAEGVAAALLDYRLTRGGARPALDPYPVPRPVGSAEVVKVKVISDGVAEAGYLWLVVDVEA